MYYSHSMPNRFSFDYLPKILFKERPFRNALTSHLHRASKAIEFDLTQRNKQNGLDLSGEQFLLLSALLEHPDFTQQELADYLCRERTTVTHALLALVKTGWLEKHTSKQDLRKNVYLPTGKVHANWDKMIRLAWESAEAGEADIAPEELTACINTLVKIFCNYRPAQKIYVLHLDEKITRGK